MNLINLSSLLPSHKSHNKSRRLPICWVSFIHSFSIVITQNDRIEHEKVYKEKKKLLDELHKRNANLVTQNEEKAQQQEEDDHLLQSLSKELRMVEKNPEGMKQRNLLERNQKEIDGTIQVIEELKAKIEELTQREKDLSKLQKQHETDLKGLREEVKEWEQKKADALELQQVVVSLEERIKAQEEEYEKERQSLKQQTRIEYNLKEKIDLDSATLSTKQTQVKQMAAELGLSDLSETSVEIAFKEETLVYQDLQRQVEEKIGQQRKVEEEIVELNQTHTQLNTRIKQLKEEIQILKQTIQETENASEPSCAELASLERTIQQMRTEQQDTVTKVFQ